MTTLISHSSNQICGHTWANFSQFLKIYFSNVNNFSQQSSRFPAEQQPWLLAHFSISVWLHLFSLFSLLTCLLAHLIVTILQPRNQHQVDLDHIVSSLDWAKSSLGFDPGVSCLWGCEGNWTEEKCHRSQVKHFLLWWSFEDQTHDPFLL